MFVPLPIILALGFLFLAAISFLVAALLSENPKRNITCWFFLFCIGIFGFLISCIWGIVKLISSVF